MARQFFESSYVEVPGGCGFPQIKGNTRITECGGTSSALAGLSLTRYSSGETEAKARTAEKWLLSRSRNGAWEAGGFYSAEPTALVLLDIRNLNISDAKLSDSTTYLESCYKDGYYLSTHDSKDQPHVFTTYIVLKCLHTYSKLLHRERIKEWILRSKSSNERWGQYPNSNTDSLVHTILALNILHYCGMSWEEIKRLHRDQINWILSHLKSADYTHEEIRIRTEEIGEHGHKYFKHNIRHFVKPYLGQLLIDLGYNREAIFVARKLLQAQFNGGWGPSGDELTMWATQQAVEFFRKVEDHVIPEINPVSYGLSYYSTIPYALPKTTTSLLGFASVLVLLFLPDYRPSIVVGLLMIVLPWLFKRQ